MTLTFVKTRPVHSIAGQSRFLAGGPHGTHPGCLGFGSWLQAPTLKPALFVQAWGRAQGVLGKWSGQGREANICKGFERKLFHNVYRLVSQCCLSHIRLFHKYFAKVDFGCWTSTFISRKRKVRHGWVRGTFTIFCMVSSKAYSVKTNSRIFTHSILIECLIIYSLSKVAGVPQLWLY